MLKNVDHFHFCKANVKKESAAFIKSLVLAVDFPKQLASFENLNLYKILQRNT